MVDSDSGGGKRGMQGGIPLARAACPELVEGQAALPNDDEDAASHPELVAGSRRWGNARSFAANRMTAMRMLQVTLSLSQGLGVSGT